MSKKKKSVRFSVYNAKNLESLRKMREDKEKELRDFDDER